MSGGSPIVGPWPNRDAEGVPLANIHDAETETVWVDEPQDNVFAEAEDVPQDMPLRTRLVQIFCVIGAIAWVGAACWAQYIALDGEMPSLMQAVDFFPRLAMPLVLLALIWLLLARTPRAVIHRVSRTVETLRAEEERFGSLLISYADQIKEGRAALAAQGALLESAGSSASDQLAAIREAVQAEIAGISSHSETLKNNAISARSELAILLADLPKAQAETMAATEALKQAGLSAHEKAGALDAQLSVLSSRSKEAEELAGGAAQKLAAHLARMDGMSETASERMTQAAGQMTQSVDEALDRAAEALATARTGLEAQGSAMLAMVEQGHASLAKAGAESTLAIGNRMAAITAQVEAMAQTLDEQDVSSQQMLERIAIDIAKIEDRISALGHGAGKTGEKAGQALDALHDKANTLTGSFESSSKSIAEMIVQSEALLAALDATVREVDETVPAAYLRLQQSAAATEAAARSAIPALVAIETSSEQTFARLKDAEALIAKQMIDISTVSEKTASSLGANLETARDMATALEDIETRARAVTETSGPQLSASMVQMRKAAEKAIEHARTAIEEAIPQSASLLATQSRDSVDAALSAQVEAQIAQMGDVTRRAVEAAQEATAQLMQQMDAIAERAQSLESRIADANEQVSKNDETVFARRVALLIESLNSTAIDVTKLLSNDVTDTAWAAYLRGDRGVFTRRAVRLLDTGEVREISRHYEDDGEFREQVNRYIHDFESMLRNILATREGGPLSVTLLSSDAGKLYVALAQAIDRLRT